MRCEVADGKFEVSSPEIDLIYIFWPTLPGCSTNVPKGSPRHEKRLHERNFPPDRGMSDVVICRPASCRLAGCIASGSASE